MAQGMRSTAREEAAMEMIIRKRIEDQHRGINEMILAYMQLHNLMLSEIEIVEQRTSNGMATYYCRERTEK